MAVLCPPAPLTVKTTLAVTPEGNDSLKTATPGESMKGMLFAAVQSSQAHDAPASVANVTIASACHLSAPVVPQVEGGRVTGCREVSQPEVVGVD